MKLLTREVLALLPPLGAQRGKPEPIAYAKFFTPDGSWTWYATEGSPEGEDFLMFGYVIGIVPEWGYLVLSELESIRGRFNLPVERDKFFKPTAVSKFVKEFPEA
jgi:hypothetical protein